jgi:hypothetical protein
MRSTADRNRFSFYQVKRIFLACPGDLTAERSRFPRLLETVNNLRAHSLGFHLEPVGWERVVPSMGRPQDLINDELDSADLVVVMFWNKIGSPSCINSERTATVEEYERAAQGQRVWVYFKRPSEEAGPQLDGVLEFRRRLEAGKQLFFREFTNLPDWEEMFREHLVAYLDGQKRWDIDEHCSSFNPDQALMKGRFLREATYRSGTRLLIEMDVDGDGRDESIRFFLSHGAYSLTLEKDGKTHRLNLPDELSDFAQIDRIHLAIKDVTNDGFPEVILAFSIDAHEVLVNVWGFRDGSFREKGIEGFQSLGRFRGQTLWPVLIYEGGTFVLRYGTAGCAWVARWTGTDYRITDEIVAAM